MRSYDVRIDITGRTALDGRLKTAATVFLPDQIKEPLTALVAYPGSGCSREYYDIRTHTGYSQAEYHTAQGFAFVACDHVGTGDSSECDLFGLNFENMASANHITACEILGHLSQGTLTDDIPPLHIDKAIGIGHSMGGCLLTVQQATHRTFDGVAMLGWSAVHEDLPSPDGSGIAVPRIPRSPDLRALRADADIAAKATARDTNLIRLAFHGLEGQSELMEADLKGVANASEPSPSIAPWRVTTIPPCFTMMAAERAVAEEAAVIEVPVLTAFGEVDCGPDPLDEPNIYSSSRNVSSVIVRKMGHMHNLALTRQVLWHRITMFAQSV
ncbi:alpha/beta hydrolase [Streptomyces sp. NPDC051985]|uniref:alpha/beta hydrolase n=1 Tax=Streptomyces sp. NPDC051985 TaxID=3155807 RepID=UPI00342D7EC1